MASLIQHHFDAAAVAAPKNIACIFNDEQVTYADLRNEANSLALSLKKNGVQQGDRVCFCLYKSINSIRAILGILKADAAYVPLDVFSPQERLKKIIKDADPRVVLCDGETFDFVKEFVEDSVKIMPILKNHDTKPVANPDYKNFTSDLAYIFYTSGSTGTPKGVMITHKNLIGCADWAVNEFGITAADILSSHPPFHFDLSTLDIYAAFRARAALAIVPDKLSVFPGALLDYIEKNKMTIWNSVPSLLSYLAKSGVLAPERMPSVKKIFFNGEVFPAKYLAQWMEIFPQKEFVNMYGPTEATVQCSFYRVKNIPVDFSKPVPIGKSCANAEIFAVTDQGKIARSGEEGELYIGGSGVGLGYWRNSEKTKAAFMQNPFRQDKDIVYKTGDLVYLNKDFDYEFLGRIDHQIKRMGYRIELGEIESALYALPYVKEAAVVTDAQDGQTEIIAFIVATDEREAESLSLDLEKIVPKYMLPQRHYVLPNLPKTSTGKIDRVSLKKQYVSQT